MKATELRIGNIVYDRGKAVNLRDSQLVNIIEGKYTEAYSAIPLTEEWLVKLGFEVKYLTIEKRVNSNFIFTILNDEKDYHFMPHATLKWGVDLKFVHQLQNLYFALTGEELKLLQ